MPTIAKYEKKDWEGVDALQRSNLLNDKVPRGYLSVCLTEEEIERINDSIGFFVARKGEKVVGFIGASSRELVEDGIFGPLGQELLRVLPSQEYKSWVSLVMSAWTRSIEGRGYSRISGRGPR